MSKKIAKNLLISFFSLLLLTIALFPDHALLKIIEIKLSPLGKFKCKRVGIKDYGLFFVDCSLKKKGYYEVGIKNIHCKKGKLFLEGVDVVLHQKGKFSQKNLEHLFLNQSFKTEIVNGTLSVTGVCDKIPWKFDQGFTVFTGPEAIELYLSLPSSNTLLLETHFSQRKLDPLFKLLAYLILPSKYESWNFPEGIISTPTLSLQLSHDKCEKIFGDVVIENLKGNKEDDFLEARLDKMEGHFAFDFSNLKECNATFSVKNGAFLSHFLEGAWNFHFAETKLIMTDGMIEKSKLYANVLGMDSEILFGGGGTDLFMEIKAKGGTDTIVEALPPAYKKVFSDAFSKNQFAIDANLKKNPLGLAVEGKITIENNVLDFGCHFGSAKREVKPSVGWFRANHLALEKFLSPFLFKNGKLAVSGTIDVEGTFDETLLLYYHGTNIHLEGPNFSLHCPKIDEGGFHCIDLKNFTTKGILPLKNATYFQKNLGVTLENSVASAYFNNKTIEIKEITTYFQDMELKGDVKIASLHSGVDVEIQSTSYKGSLEAANSLLTHCLPQFHWKVPLGGTLRSEDGFFFHYLFDGQTKLLDASLFGTLECSYLGKLLSLNNYSVQFAYDKSENALQFFEGMGSLTLAGIEESYQIRTPHLLLFDFPNLDLSFNMFLKKNEHAILNFLCKTEKMEKGRKISVEGEQFQLEGYQEGKQLSVKEFKWGALSGNGTFDFSNGEAIGSEFFIASKEFGALHCRGVFEKTKDAFSANFPIVTFDLNQDYKLAPLKNCALYVDRNGIEIEADYSINDVFYPISFVIGSNLREGVLTINKGLDIHWKKEKGDKLHLTKIVGKFLGIEASLVENRESNLIDHVAMSGKIDLDMASLKPLLNTTQKNWIEKLGVGSGYTLMGDFIIQPLKLSETLFSGKVMGNNFVIGALRLDSLSADVAYCPNNLEIRNLQINDWGGKALIERAQFKKCDATWDFSIPSIKLEDIHLSKLRKIKNKKGFFKPFQVQSFVLHDFHGKVGDMLTYKGGGELQFTHLSRKTFFSTLLFLPKEITSRLGLDLNLLIPARGTIHYFIDDGKVNLSKFKGVYSAGKRSRFYLAEGQPAYVDFDGNLNLKVKMKQYNLLMKLAELFVITVKGNILDPTYSLTNHLESGMDEKED